MTPEVQWPATDLTEQFRELDDDYEIPNAILGFDPMEIVILPDRPFTPARIKMREVSDWSAYADLLKQREIAAPAAVPLPTPRPTHVPGPALAGLSVTPSPSGVGQSLRQRLPSVDPATQPVVQRQVYNVDQGVVETTPPTCSCSSISHQSCSFPYRWKVNIEADALSGPVASKGNTHGPHQIPSLDSVISECSCLQTCRICLLPSALLRRIASVTSSQPNEATFEQITTDLLKLKLTFLPIGVVPTTSTRTISND
jgi:hypothetical protein